MKLTLGLAQRILALSILLILGCNSQSSKNELTIGGLLHLTGEIAIQGEAFRQGMELAADSINQQGGVPGVGNIKLIFEDTQYRPMEALTGVKKLLQGRRADAVLISTVSEAKAAGPELQKAKVPGLVLWDSSPEIEQLGDQLFGIGPWTPATGQTAAAFTKGKLGASAAAVISSNTEWSASVSAEFIGSFKKLNGKIGSHIELNPQESDFRTTLLKIKSENPQALYAPVDSNIPTFFAQARQVIPNIPIVTSDVITEDYFEAKSRDYEGVYQTMTRSTDLEKINALQAKYTAKFGRPCKQLDFVAWAYDAVTVVADAAKRRQENKTEKLSEEIRSTKEFDGYSGKITFSKSGSAPRSLNVFKVHDWNFEIVN